MKYSIYRTDLFDVQLREIILRINNNYGTEIAIDVLEKIENHIMSLSEFPYMGTIPRYEVLRQKGYKILIEQKNIMFYKIDEETKSITMYAIVNQNSDYLHVILSI